MATINFKEEFANVVDVESFKKYSFGSTPVNSLNRIKFCGGANKFSSLCGFHFKLKQQNEKNIAQIIDRSKTIKAFTFEDLRIVFCAKLRSKIYRQAIYNPSEWFIFGKISNDRIQVLSREDCLYATSTDEDYSNGFDIEKFFETDLFETYVQKFTHVVKIGLKSSAAFIDKINNDIKNHVSKYETHEVIDIDRYLRAIRESIPLIGSKNYMDKTFVLQDLDIKNVLSELNKR